MFRIANGWTRTRLSPGLLAAAVCVGLMLALPAPLARLRPAAAALPCPCSIFSPTSVPVMPADPDGNAVEIGTKFRADVAGFVAGVRFYKGPGNTGTHVGKLWTRGGTRLASVTFSGETATGWQQAMFSSPVAVNANTTYIISYYAPNGHYANDDFVFQGQGVDNAPLHALRDGQDGPNGVYRYGTGGGFPTNTWQSTNYWVDVVFNTAPADTTPPTVTSNSPANGATGVPLGTTVSATLSEPIQTGTAQLALTGAGGAAVAGSTTYNATTRTVTFTPSAPLATSTVHTATASGARDPAGNTMAPFSWTFTTAPTASNCPCTIWPDTATPAIVTANDNNAIEIGVRFRSSTAGFITGLRFYKGPNNTGTHIGSLWTNTGTRLSMVTFTGETGSGWQNASLPAPVQITPNVTYVASYHTDVGFYSATNSDFVSSVARGPLTALQDGLDGANGVYLYGGGGFPTNTFSSTNYFVDVVFHTTGTDTVAPTLVARAPAPGAVGVPTSTRVTVTFSEPVTPSTIVMTLTGPSGSVAGTTAYDAPTTTATFTPNSALAQSTSYTASVSGARDPSNNQMSPVSWSFTTAAAAPPPPDQGPGGPVLVIKNPNVPASQFTPFLAEVLRTEGLNEFATADLSTVTATTLNQFDTVLLGSMSLTATQVSMFTSWVNAGGNLIAFRPDAQLAGLLGLTDTPNTLTEAYLRADTTSAPGAGITNQTMQFHGTADRYTLNGARAVATLYSDATTATSNPAVSLVSVGASGGQAAAFAYDLPQSLVYTRQGNPVWEQQERDGQAPIRSDDLYFGGGSPDWVNLNKVAVPQADEQQRLLANLIGAMNLDRKPLPRFWYLPRSAKAVVVATGDDHANGGTAGRFDQYVANSLAGCVVANWECLRFSSYIYPNTPLTNSQASAYNGAGFEVGLHPQNNCGNFTPASLDSDYATQLSQFTQKYTSVPAPTTSRFHCIVWSDWGSQPAVSGNYGIRLDTNYYYWPGSWITDRPGFMTGSGMPMRFIDKTGGFINVYQAPTQMTDESDQSYPFTPNTLLDAAIGSLGYYGVFTANMHTDLPTTFQSDQLLASAQSHGVPLVSSRQMLTWLNGRNASSYSGIAWNGTSRTLTFTVNVGSGAGGLTGMVPTAGPGGTVLSTLTRGGTAVPFTRTTIKGVEYAMFLASAGAHTATYATAAKPPAPPVTVVEAPTATSATLQVTSAGATGTEVVYGTAPTALTGRAVDGTQGTHHTVTLTDLKPATTYYYRVRVRGSTGKTVTAAALGTLTTPEPDAQAPTISDVRVDPQPDRTAPVRWRTTENTDATLLVGPRPNALVELYDDKRDNAHTVVVTRLDPATTYYYRVRSVDSAGNATVFPPLNQPPAEFVSDANGVTDQTVATFRTNKGVTRTYVQDDSLGELALAPTAAEEFDTTSLPSTWDNEPEVPGGSTTVYRGYLVLDGQRTGTKDKFDPGSAMEFRATFSGPGEQAVGLSTGNGQGNNPSASIILRDGVLVAAANKGNDRVTLPLPGNLLGTAHVYRIDWVDDRVTFWVDGAQVGSIQTALKKMGPRARDSAADGTPLVVDWMRLFGASTDGTQVSRILDAQQMVTWDRLTYRADVPAGATLRVSVRTGSTSTPDGTWTAFTPVGPGGRVAASSRFLQYRVEMNTTVPGRTPVLRDIAVTHNGVTFNPPTEF